MGQTKENGSFWKRDIKFSAVLRLVGAIVLLLFVGLCMTDWRSLEKSLRIQDGKRRTLTVRPQLTKQTDSPAALEQILRNDPDDAVRARAAGKLADIGGEALRPLVAGLRDRSPRVRLKAIDGLEHSAEKSGFAADALCEALLDSNRDVSAGASATLRHVPTANAVPALVKKLIDLRPAMRRAAAHECSELPLSDKSDLKAEIVQALARLLTDPETHVALTAAVSLRKWEPGENVLPVFKRALVDKAAEVRITAVHEVGLMLHEAIGLANLRKALRSHPLYHPRLIDILPNDLSRFVERIGNEIRAFREGILHECLGRFQLGAQISFLIRMASVFGGGPDAIEPELIWMPLVAAALDDAEPTVRLAAIYALTGGTPRSSDSALWLAEMSTLRDDRSTRSSGVFPEAEPHVPALVKRLKDESEEVRAAATQALGIICRRDALCVPVLVSALRDESEKVRTEAALSLATFGPAAAPALERLLECFERDSSPLVRSASIYTLGRIGPDAKVAIPAILAAIRGMPSHPENDDESAYKEREARLHPLLKALAGIAPADQQTIDVLTEIVRDKNQHEWSRALAAKALGRIGVPAKSAFDVLLRASETRSETLRVFAMGALCDVAPADRRAIDVLTEIVRDKDNRQTNWARARSAKALGRIGAPAKSAFDALLQASQTEHKELCHAASDACYRVDAEAARNTHEIGRIPERRRVEDLMIPRDRLRRER
jgi:HEAT repeat protein